MKFDLQHRAKFPVLIVVGCCTALGLSFFFSPPERLNVIITILTAFGGITAFLYSKHSQEIELFRDLFREFNSRYDKLNERLNETYKRTINEQLKPTDYGVFYDYFNLCAEEQMYARAGCIDSNVWRAWENGMIYFSENSEILNFWQLELQQDSYYGFTIPQRNKTLTLKPVITVTMPDGIQLFEVRIL